MGGTSLDLGHNDPAQCQLGVGIRRSGYQSGKPSPRRGGVAVKSILSKGDLARIPSCYGLAMMGRGLAALLYR